MLQAVLNRFETVDRLADLIRLDAQQSTGANCRQNILDVVQTLQRDLGGEHDFLNSIWAAEEESSILQEGSLIDFLFPAEPEHLRLGAIRKLRASRIVEIQHGKVVRLLVLKDARFGVGVGFESTMAIEMVRSDVENDRDFWPEGLDGF